MSVIVTEVLHGAKAVFRDDEEETSALDSSSNYSSSSGKINGETIVEEFEGFEEGKTLTKSTTRTVTVPYTHKVKVPVITKRIVPATVQMEVKTKELVEVEHYENVEETYTAMEERVTMVPKVVWQKKMVEQEIVRKVPVTKTRIVRKPKITIEEKDVYKVVEVPTNKIVESEGYRVDVVEDMRVVEVEEIEEYELVPHFVRTVKGRERTISEVKENHGARSQGSIVYLKGDRQISTIPDDQTLLGQPKITMVQSRDKTSRVHLTVLDLVNEYFTVQNRSVEPIMLTGWCVTDQSYQDGNADTNVYRFPDGFSLDPGSSVSVYCGKDWNSREYDGVTELLWHEKKGVAVWNNDGDTAYLVAPDGLVKSALEAKAGAKRVMKRPKRGMYGERPSNKKPRL